MGETAKSVPEGHEQLRIPLIRERETDDRGGIEELAGRIGDGGPARLGWLVPRCIAGAAGDAQSEASSLGRTESTKSARKSGPCTVGSSQGAVLGVGYAWRGNLPLLDSHDVSELEEHGEVPSAGNIRSQAAAVGRSANQVWSWDITKLRGPVKWTYYYLYVILEIFSRYVVGWMLAHRESAALAQRLIAESCRKQDIEPDQLTLHADRGSSMRSKPVGLLLADLGVTKTHSRPYVSNDNPYSESQFKTMKYCPQFPSRFGSAEDGRLFCCGFFAY